MLRLNVALAWAACTFALSACYHPIVKGDALRPGALDAVLAKVERARGIETDDEVKVSIVSGERLTDVVRTAMFRGWPPADLDAYQESLIAMGLWPADKRLVDELVAVMGAEAVGLYVPEDRALYVVGDPAIPLRVRLASAIARRDIVREYALAHELVHYLQHRAQPALFDALLALRDSDDTAWALQAAVEGDAVRYGFAAVEGGVPPPAPVDFRMRLEQAAAEGPLAAQPRFVREGIVFPYAHGYRLAVLEATLLLERPPASTEQAMHADKRHEPFTVFELPPSTELEHGCVPLWRNSLGELGMSMLFRELEPQPAPKTWQGWDGDRYLAAHCDGRREIVWLTSWDSEKDAEEFTEAYGTFAVRLAVRGDLASVPRIERDGREAIVFTRGLEGYARSALRSAGRRQASRPADVLPGLRAATRPQTAR